MSHGSHCCAPVPAWHVTPPTCNQPTNQPTAGPQEVDQRHREQGQHHQHQEHAGRGVPREPRARPRPFLPLHDEVAAGLTRVLARVRWWVL